MTRSDIAELRYAVGQLRQSIGALRSNYGDAATIRRRRTTSSGRHRRRGLRQAPPPELAVPRRSEPIYVPDSKSDEAAWMGAQDEGLGFHSAPERSKNLITGATALPTGSSRRPVLLERWRARAGPFGPPIFPPYGHSFVAPFAQSRSGRAPLG